MDENKTLFIQYKEELRDDLKIDRLELEQKALSVAGLKGKWIGRLMTHKHDLEELEEAYDNAMSSLIETIMKESPVGITRLTAEKTAMNHESIKKVKKAMKETRLLIEYIEKLEKVFSNMSYDITNVINVIKMEIF